MLNKDEKSRDDQAEEANESPDPASVEDDAVCSDDFLSGVPAALPLPEEAFFSSFKMEKK